MENSKYGTVRMWDISKGGAWETTLEKAAGQTMYQVPSSRTAFVQVDNVVDLNAWKAAHEDIEDGYDEYDAYEDYEDEPYLRPRDHQEEFWDVYDPQMDVPQDIDLRQLLRHAKEKGAYVDPDLYAAFLRQEEEEAKAEAEKVQAQRRESGPRWLPNLLQTGELAATGMVLAVGIALLCKVLLG